MSPIPNIPIPSKLLKEAKAEPHQHPYDLAAYVVVIDTLLRKGLSYAKIAKWLSVRLEMPVKRGQVFYVYKTWLGKRESAKAQDDLEKAELETAGDPLTGEGASDPESEQFLKDSQDAQLDRAADEEDSKRRKGRRKKK